MRKGLNAIVAVVMATVLILMSTAKAVSALTDISGSEIINITDTYFLQMLINQGVDTNKDGKISVNEMESLNYLYVYDPNGQVASLSGIEYAKNLNTLSLNVSTKISNINFVKNMLNLSYLGISINNYSDTYTLDISSISNLTKLSTIRMNNCGISDISSLKNLNNLTNVSLSSNKITDISSLVSLSQLSDIDLSYNQITDISPLGLLPGLFRVTLTNNKFTDITSLKKLNNLYYLDINGNNVSDAAKFDIIRVSVGEMFKGQKKECEVRPMNVLNGVSISVDSNNNIISYGDENSPYSITALNAGSATLKLQYENLAKLTTIKVSGIDANQPLESSTNVTTEFYDDRAALNSKGELWNLADNGPKVVMNNVKKYVAYSAYEGDFNSPTDYRLAIDNNNTLWSWAGDTYSDGKTIAFQNNKREMDNVKSVNTRYAVTYNNELFDYCKDDGKLIDNVKQVERINNYDLGRVAKIGTEVLKTDNTLWVRHDGNLQQASESFTKVADGVKELTSSDGYFYSGYIKDDGTFWECKSGEDYWYNGSSKNIGFIKVADNVSAVVENYIVKTDGTVIDREHDKVILTTGLKEVKDNQYIVDNNNTLWSYNPYSEIQKISDGFKKFTYNGFEKIDGTIYDYNNQPTDYVKSVFAYFNVGSDMMLGKDNVVYASGVKVLTNVSNIYKFAYNESPIYAARTDGTIWEVGDMLPTKVISANFDINNDGKVDMLDLSTIGSKYNTKSISIGYKSEYDFNKDNIIDIYDVVSVARRLTI